MVMSKPIISNLLIKQILSNVQSIFILCFLFLAGNTLKAQQEPMYSQYMFNMVQINPAYAGNRAVDNITTTFRKQWVGLDGAPTTATLSWDRREAESNVGYGLQIYTDKIGIESTTGIQGFYSYRIPFVKSSLSLGLSAGVLNYCAAYSQSITTTGGDPLFQEDINGLRPTVGIGALYATEHWYAGFSVPALLQTKITLDNVQVTSGADNHYFLTGGYIFDVSNSVKLKPSLLLKAVKGAPLEYDLNLNAWIQDIVGLGVSYRTGDSFVGMFELQISPQFRLGYAYDYLISNLKTYTKGTHELMLRYEFAPAQNQRILSPRYY
jgi:type IX secretion system PorP/SprF family membrane protein